MKHWTLLATALLIPLAALAQDLPPPDVPPDELPPLEEAPPDDEPKEKPRPARKKPLDLVVKRAPSAKPPLKGKRLNVDVDGVALSDVMQAIGRQAGVNLVVSPQVKSVLTVSLRDIPWREAVDVIAKMTRCEVREGPGGILFLEQPARITLDLDKTPIAVVCQLIAKSSGANVVLGPGVAGSVSLDIKELHWQQALKLAARSAGAHLEVAEGVALITKAPLKPRPATPNPLGKGPAGPLLNIDLEDVRADDFAARLGQVAAQNLVGDSRLEGELTLALRSVSWRDAVTTFALQSGSRLERGLGGVVRIVGVPPVATPLTLDNVDLRDALCAVAAAGGQNVVVDPRLSARVSVHLVSRGEDVLRALARASGVRLVPWRGGILLATTASVPPAPPVAVTAGGKRIDAVFRDADLADVMEALGLKVKRNFLVHPSVTERVTCNLKGIDWRYAVEVLARNSGCKVEERRGGILLLTQAPKTRIRAHNVPLAPFLRILAANGGKNLVLTAGVKGKVSLDLRNVYWLDVLYASARIAGCTVTEGTTDVLTISRSGPPLAPAPAPADRRYAGGVEALVAKVRAAALAKDLAALGRASRELSAAVQAAQPKPSVSEGPPEPSPKALAKLALRSEALMQKIDSYAAGRKVDELVEAFAHLRKVMQEPGGAAVVSRSLKKWRARWASYGEIVLSITLQIHITRGNLLLRSMAEAIRAGRFAYVQLLFDRVKELRETMFLEKRSVFHRNGEALHVRAKTLSERAAALESVDKEYPGLVLQATLTGSSMGARFRDAAVVGGVAVREGGPKTKGAPSAVSIEPGIIRFRERDLEFVRELK
jgi:hypothetical protein